MPSLSSYNSAEGATLEEELKLAGVNPLDFGGLHGLFSVEGFGLMGDPESELEPFMPLIREQMSDVIAVGTDYDYNPEKLSFALYGTHDLGYLLMRLNGSMSRAEFRGPSIRIVKVESASQLIKAHEVARARANVRRATPDQYADLTIRQVRTAT